MVQFQIEHLMAVLVQSRGGAPNRQFGRLAEQFLTVADSKPLLANVRRLTVGSLLRNSLHSNGFHMGRTQQCTIDGYTFRFRKNGRLKQASWAHIALAFGASLEILRNALDSPSFSAGFLVTDRFASSVRRHGR